MHHYNFISYCLERDLLPFDVQPSKLSIWIDFQEPQSARITKEVEPSEGVSSDLHE